MMGSLPLLLLCTQSLEKYVELLNFPFIIGNGNDKTCDGHCGGGAPSGCYCDDMCHKYGDCCDDKSDHCGDEPTSGHSPFPSYPGPDMNFVEPGSGMDFSEPSYMNFPVPPYMNFPQPGSDMNFLDPSHMNFPQPGSDMNFMEPSYMNFP